MTLSELICKLQDYAHQGYALDEILVYDKTGNIFSVPEKIEIKSNEEGIVELIVHESTEA